MPKFLAKWIIALAVSQSAFATLLLAGDLTPEQGKTLNKADIVILGEVHDNRAHHDGQARFIRQIAPKAIVFEMLSAEQAETINGDSRADLIALSEKIDWAGSGWPEFDIYFPVFEATGDIPVFGAAAPRGTVRAAFSEGAAETFGEGAERFGLHQPLPQAQAERRAEMQYLSHCEAMPREMMPGMVEAQRFRDAQFSAVALAAYEKHGGPVVVITGNGHARRDWAMPAMIGLAAPELKVFVVGFVEAPAEGNDPRFDVTIVTDAAERPDPCEKLRAKKE